MIMEPHHSLMKVYIHHHNIRRIAIFVHTTVYAPINGMPHPPVLGLTGGRDGGFVLKILSQGVGQLYNYVLYHYDITVLKLAHVHTVSTYACVFV